jgi:menaquinone-9 beta-reductase
VLSDALKVNQDWDAACREYARAHDDYFAILHVVDNCLRELFLDPGPEADARRSRALPALESGAVQLPDQGFCGPDRPFRAADRRRLFGDD